MKGKWQVMSRMKLILSSGLALCAMLGVAGTAVASAAEFLLEGGRSFPQKFNSGLIELEDAALLHSSLLGVNVTIECDRVQLVKGELVNAANETAEIAYSLCTVLEPTGCGVHQPVIVLALGEPKTATEVEVKPISGPFVTFELVSCSLAGKYEFKGSQICLVENGNLQTTHDMTCETSGSKLKFFTSAATYESEPLLASLESGATFGQG